MNSSYILSHTPFTLHTRRICPSSAEPFSPCSSNDMMGPLLRGKRGSVWTGSATQLKCRHGREKEDYSHPNHSFVLEPHVDNKERAKWWKNKQEGEKKKKKGHLVLVQLLSTAIISSWIHINRRFGASEKKMQMFFSAPASRTNHVKWCLYLEERICRDSDDL